MNTDPVQMPVKYRTHLQIILVCRRRLRPPSSSCNCQAPTVQYLAWQVHLLGSGSCLPLPGRLSTDHLWFFRTMNTDTSKGSVQANVLQRYGVISSCAGPIATPVEGLVLVGWLLGMRTLTSVMPHYTTMKTAFCFVLPGLSL